MLWLLSLRTQCLSVLLVCVLHSHYWKLLSEIEILFGILFGMCLHNKAYVWETHLTRKETFIEGDLLLAAVFPPVPEHELPIAFISCLVTVRAIWAGGWCHPGIRLRYYLQSPVPDTSHGPPYTFPEFINVRL